MDISHLSAFIGSWRTTGKISSRQGDATDHLVASDVYEWFSGGHFILHHVNGYIGSQEVRALEILSYDRKANTFVSNSIDNSGNSSNYILKLDGYNWNIDGKTERFRGSFDESFSVLSGKWFLVDDQGNEKPWMEIHLVKEL